MKTKRQLQIASQVQRELAQILLLHTDEPIFKKITLSLVEVSPDLEFAKVYYTVFDPTQIKAAQTALQQAASRLRHALAVNLNLRKTPKLNFYYDESIQRGQKLSALIDQAIAEDSKFIQADDEAQN